MQASTWHAGANSIVCQVSNVASDVIKRNTLALCEERPCRGGSGVIGSGKLNSTSSHLQSESWANQTPFPPELWIPCPHTLQSKGKSRTFLHVLQAHPGFAVHMFVSTEAWHTSTAHVLKPWVTFPGQLCPVAYTRLERPKLWQRHQRMKGLKKCQSGRHHKSMFKQGTPEVQRWRRTHCILLKEELQLAHRIGK